ncbi:right-handed parallel beta-helix repeat-containing protein [uncultured Mucilaginibacter sp.]|uniref:right-handed parallel beta-helix repeat-containing protein n=1 Tax=uncultured Mucilaginibacter sp. TaxID=797541 RepID=UPI0025F63169|nr:right-handed parallel beta-helix repeat-containing protein [uncultured Mucilaginibacter sp.]
MKIEPLNFLTTPEKRGNFFSEKMNAMKNSYKLCIPIMQILFSLLIVTPNCKGQEANWEYKNVPKDEIKESNALLPFRKKASILSSRAYDLINSLPPNYVKDGSVDYTEQLQKAINANNIVMFPNFPVLVNHLGLSLISNSTIIFRKYSKLVLQANGLPAYQILRIYNATNVNLYFPVVQGDRDLHSGNGQWGMGISISGSTKILVVNPKVSKCWGDGIYLGRQNDAVDRNITIFYAELDNNRRNGLSITCADGVHLIRPIISNTAGQMPMSGIDIEPNTNADVIKNIRIDNAFTFNSAMHGIVVSLHGLRGDAPQQVSISINNHVDEGSAIGFGLAINLADKNNGPPLTGQINVLNPLWKNSKKKGFQVYKAPNNVSMIDVKFKNTSIFKNNNTDNDGISDMKTQLNYDRRIFVE